MRHASPMYREDEMQSKANFAFACGFIAATVMITGLLLAVML